PRSGSNLHGGASDDPARPPRDRPHPGEARLVRHQTPLRSLWRTLGIRMKRIDALRSTVLLAIASSLVLAGCALKQPPFGADIMPESARAKIPGSWAGPHRSGAVVPNWIRAFGDAELTALVADAVERNPDLKAAAAPASTRARMKHRSVGCMASPQAPHGRPTYGAGFARKKLPQKLKAARWKPTTNLPDNHSPLQWRARTSRPSRPRNRKPTRRKLSISTRSIRSSPTCANSRGSRATLMFRRSGRAPPARRRHSTPRSRLGRRQSARSRSSRAAIPLARLMCDVPSPVNREACPPVCL